MSDIRSFVVDPDSAGVRLDRFLVSVLNEFSRSEIQRFPVRVNDAPAKFSVRLRPGDRIDVEIVPRTTEIAYDNISSDFDLDILYEDDDIIVVN